ncbi:MAG: tetratricopeptide repeat protein [Bacteroidota bacterium]
MKRINYLASFLLAAVVLSSCGGIDKMKEEASDLKFNVTPKVLEVHGGQVEYTIKGDVPGEWFNKKAIVEFTPALTYEGGEKLGDSKTYQGEKVEANNKVIAYETGGAVEFSGSFEYDENMRVADLEMRGTATIGDNTIALPSMKVADGVISTSQLVQVKPMPIMSADRFERITEVNQMADIHYVIQRSNIRRSELSNEDITKLEEFIKEVDARKELEYKGIEVDAYASPDGPLDLNERLSKNRKESADSYLKKALNGTKISELEAQQIFRMRTTAEDWDGFKKLVEASDIQDKEIILRVLSMYSDPAVREKEIKNIAATYEVLAEDILPLLRRSELKLNVNKIGFTDEEIKDYLNSNPDTLNLEEALFAGKIIADLDQKMKAFQLAAKIESACFRAQNNIGYVHMKKGNVDAAKAAFEKANELKSGNAVVLNNLGAIALVEGEKEAAEEYFLKATDAGAAVDYNLGIIKIMDGEYDAAVNYFQDHTTFNTALAMLLAGKTDAAMKTVEALEDDAAMNYYLKAVIAARIGDEAVVMNSLRTAVAKEGSLKEMAKTDLEFADYFANETFVGIVE